MFVSGTSLVSSIGSQTQNHFSSIVAQEQSARTNVIDALKDSIYSDGKQKGVTFAASVIKKEAVGVFQGYMKIFEYLDSPIATAMEEILTYIGIPPKVFTAVKYAIQSDSIGLDPHEKWGISYDKYEVIVEIHNLINELRSLEKFSSYIREKRKKEIEQELQELFISIKKLA